MSKNQSSKQGGKQQSSEEQSAADRLKARLRAAISKKQKGRGSQRGDGRRSSGASRDAPRGTDNYGRSGGNAHRGNSPDKGDQRQASSRNQDDRAGYTLKPRSGYRPATHGGGSSSRDTRPPSRRDSAPARTSGGKVHQDGRDIPPRQNQQGRQQDGGQQRQPPARNNVPERPRRDAAAQGERRSNADGDRSRPDRRIPSDRELQAPGPSRIDTRRVNDHAIVQAIERGADDGEGDFKNRLRGMARDYEVNRSETNSMMFAARQSRVESRVEALGKAYKMGFELYQMLCIEVARLGTPVFKNDQDCKSYVRNENN